MITDPFFVDNCSDKKSARTEDITFGLKKKKDINSKKNVRKTTREKQAICQVMLLHVVSFNVTIEMKKKKIKGGMTSAGSTVPFLPLWCRAYF